MKIIKPLQIMGKQTVVEQDNRFHLIVSSSLGIRLSNGAAILEMDAMSESIEAMGSNPMPDMGMPKPKAEYLVSGKYFSPGGVAVTGGEVKVEFAGKAKSLYVFGDRSWEMGVPGQPQLITEMPLDYSRAFGGSGYSKNPDGTGYQEERLPNIEHPDQLISSANSHVNPAGFGVINLMAEQRARFQGTYDDSYLQKYYPGYPADFDWHFFMCADEDQWSQEYYVGTESFALHNMHPEKPLITGQLPGYLARCFAQIEKRPDLLEIKLSLDTVWFFPEKDLCLLTWRGGVDVNDDEAEEVKCLMLAYENRKDGKRDITHYENAFASLSNSKEPLLSQLSSDELIPDDELCAMQILQDKALESSSESEFGKNLDAKAKSVAALTTEKVEQAMKEMKTNLPDNAAIDDQEVLNIEKIWNSLPAQESDIDVIELKKELEKIFPGITAGDPKKLKLKGFTFAKIDAIMLAIDKFQQKKQMFASEQLDKAKNEMRNNLDQQIQTVNLADNDSRKKLQESLAQLDQMGTPSPVMLPRIDANAILGQLDTLTPSAMEAIQNLQNMKAMGVDEDTIKQMEAMIHQSTGAQDNQMKERMCEIEHEFKNIYRDTAHFQVPGIAPHKNSLDERRQEFLHALKSAQGVRDQDWSCLDLSGLQLDGIDLSNAYLEQVDLRGTSLRRANLNGAIMARANLDNADFSGSAFNNTNLGAVSAKNTNFTDCILNAAKLSKGDFTGSTFKSAHLDSVEILEIIINKADFSEANMNGFQFIKLQIHGASFAAAQLPAVAFLQCQLNDCDFSSSILTSSIWADCKISHCLFDRAEMRSACFASTNPELDRLEQISFSGACLDKANFQGIHMQRADLSSASVIYANFSSADLYGANLSGAIAHNALFRKAILTNANLEKIDLREGVLSKAHMTGANLCGANLYAVDFLRATMGETLFNGSNLDNTIIRDWRPS